MTNHQIDQTTVVITYGMNCTSRHHYLNWQVDIILWKSEIRSGKLKLSMKSRNEELIGQFCNWCRLVGSLSQRGRSLLRFFNYLCRLDWSLCSLPWWNWIVKVHYNFSNHYLVISLKLIWQVDINKWHADIKIRQVNMIVWQVVAEISST